MTPLIQIDEEGYFMANTVRISDEEYAQSLLANMGRNEQGLIVTQMDGAEVLVEAFDEPIIVRHVSRLKPGHWQMSCLYSHEEEFDPHTLTVDEWDRFHGHSQKKIPFVLSRSAQADLFNLCDSFDDDSVTLDGERIAVPEWLRGEEPYTEAQWWNQIYHQDPGFDLHQPAPMLVSLLDKLKLPKSRVLILGAGPCNDATYWADRGHLVTAVDFSSEAFAEAVRRGGARPNLQMLEHDIFHLPRAFDQSFDLVFEHTCYCAIDPSRRNELVNVWKRCLVDNGQLFGIFFTMDKPQGPPYGGSEWEVRERLRKDFQFHYWSRAYNSVKGREGKEFYVFAHKKSKT